MKRPFKRVFGFSKDYVSPNLLNLIAMAFVNWYSDPIDSDKLPTGWKKIVANALKCKMDEDFHHYMKANISEIANESNKYYKSAYELPF